MKTLLNKLLGRISIAVFALACLSAMEPSHAVETITYIHNDIAGTPLLATDAAGAVLWKENYRPYGDKLNNPPTGADNKLGFTGKPYDANTGLSYMGARYYDPVIGRFTGTDSLDFDERNLHSFNRYAYANNNPYKFVDPDGRAGVLVIAAVGVALWLGTEALPMPNVPWDSGVAIPTSLPDATSALKGLGLAVGIAGSLKQAATKEAGEAAAKGSLKGVDDLVGAAAGNARSSGDIAVQGGRERAKELFREFDAKGAGNRTIVRDKTGGGRGVEGALEDGTPLRIRMKPDGTTRIQAGEQKFIFPPN